MRSRWNSVSKAQTSTSRSRRRSSASPASIGDDGWGGVARSGVRSAELDRQAGVDPGQRAAGDVDGVDALAPEPLRGLAGCGPRSGRSPGAVPAVGTSSTRSTSSPRGMRITPGTWASSYSSGLRTSRTVTPASSRGASSATSISGTSIGGRVPGPVRPVGHRSSRWSGQLLGGVGVGEGGRVQTGDADDVEARWPARRAARSPAAKAAGQDWLGPAALGGVEQLVAAVVQRGGHVGLARGRRPPR